MNDRAERIARWWDRAAAGYDAYFVPRFAPWVRVAVEALDNIPDGPIVVPCCGTFPELDALLERWPDREIVGIDLSGGMVDLARKRAAGRPNVTVVQGDAATLEPDTYAAVVSVFGLQQLPAPADAIRSWAAALRTGGRLSVVYWPDIIETEGPFALLRNDNSDSAWEAQLAEEVTAAGARLERDEHPAFDMSHVDARTFIDAYTKAGPGSDYDQRDDFLRRAPEGEWHHRPRARLIVATRHLRPRTEADLNA